MNAISPVSRLIGDNWSITVPAVDELSGVAIDLSRATAVGAEIITPNRVYDLSDYSNGTVTVVSPPSAGKIRVAVTSAVTRTLSDVPARSPSTGTRLHVFFTDIDGGKIKVGVVLIKPTRI